MFVLALIVALLVFLFVVWPRIRMRQVLAKAFPSNYAKILRRNIPQYRYMPTDLQMQLKKRIKQFLHEKTFVGCDGLMVTDEMRVTVAGKACLLLLNRETEVYPELTHILLYPGAFVAQRREVQSGGIVTHTNQGLSGESWSDGRVVLAWDQVLGSSEEQAHAHDLVLHEFAHQLDSQTGSTNGAPLLKNAEAYETWSKVMTREFEQLRADIEQGFQTIIDPYGATNPAEFFAVTTEAYFQSSEALAQYHPALFQQLYTYYRVDPRDWQ